MFLLYQIDNNSYSNAYMLWYMRERPTAQIHNDLVSISEKDEALLLPEDIRKEILLENEKVRKARQDYEFSCDKMTIPIYHDDKFENMTGDKTKTLTDLVKYLAEQKKVSDLSLFRIRWYYPAKKVLGAPLTQEEMNKPIKEVMYDDQARLQALFIEERKPDTEFLQYNKDDVMIRISLPIQHGFTSPLVFFIPKTIDLKGFKLSIEKRFNIKTTAQVILFRICNPYNNVVSHVQLFGDDKILLQDFPGFEAGDVLYVGHVDTAHPMSPLEALELQYSLGMLKLRIPASYFGSKDDIVQDVSYFRKDTFGVLKQQLSSMLNDDPNNFKIQTDADDKAYVFDTDSYLSELVNGQTVYVNKGQQLSKNQYNVTFYLYHPKLPKPVSPPAAEDTKNPPESDRQISRPAAGSIYHTRHRSLDSSAAESEEAAEGLLGPLFEHGTTVHYGTVTTYYRGRSNPQERVQFEFDEDPMFDSHASESKLFENLFTMAVKKETTVAELKQMVLAKLKEQHPDKFTSLFEAQIRIRERVHGKFFPGKILTDSQTPLLAIASSSPNREVVVERIEKSEKISDDNMSIRVAQFSPSKWQLGKSEEVIVHRDMTILQLMRLLAQKFNIPESQVEICKVPFQLQYQLKYTSTFSTLVWQQQDLSAVITKQPWFLKDGELVLVKDGSEIDYFTLQARQQATTTTTTADSDVAMRDADSVIALGYSKTSLTSSQQQQQSGKRKFEGIRFYTEEESKKEETKKTEETK